jgi:hypothetical protein
VNNFKHDHQVLLTDENLVEHRSTIYGGHSLDGSLPTEVLQNKNFLSHSDINMPVKDALKSL